MQTRFEDKFCKMVPLGIRWAFPSKEVKKLWEPKGKIFRPPWHPRVCIHVVVWVLQRFVPWCRQTFFVIFFSKVC